MDSRRPAGSGPATLDGWDVVVPRDDPGTPEVRAVALPPPDEGAARLAVERFGLSANNRSYAQLGDVLGNWTAFPAPEGHGRVPVWGYAVVEASAHPDVEVGARYFGYLPMSSHLVVRPEPAPGGFEDASPHRAGLSDFYRRYLEVGPPADEDDVQALVAPLYQASFVLADVVGAALHGGTGTVLVSSASSKTALGLADRLSRRPGLELHGLTSAGHEGFVREVGDYGAVSSYDEVDGLDLADPVVFVDVAGIAEVASAVHHRFADRLAASIVVGGTHVKAFAPPAALPGPAPEQFDGPGAIVRRREKLGVEVRDEEYAAAEDAFVARAARWLTVDRGAGSQAVVEAFTALWSGSLAADRGVVIRP